VLYWDSVYSKLRWTAGPAVASVHRAIDRDYIAASRLDVGAAYNVVHLTNFAVIKQPETSHEGGGDYGDYLGLDRLNTAG
jgi:hypothetical protein